MNAAFLFAIFWFVVSIFSVTNAIHAFRPSRSVLFFVPSFFATWMLLELAGHHIAFLLVGAAVLWGVGEALTPFGLLTLALNAISIVLLSIHIHRAQRATHTFRDALKGYVEELDGPRVPKTQLLYPFRPQRAGTQRTRDVEFSRVAGKSLKLDVYEPTAPASGPRPAIVQIHGGAWVFGDKREQGLPLLYHLAAQGWVGFNVNYRLSPGATFPEHLIDIKRAIAWIRAHAEEYNIDPNFIAVTGGSAGGHLTALTALTSNDPRYQPGFEDADTSVQAAVPFYGIYDFTDKLRLLGKGFMTKFLEPIVMKAFLDEEPEKFHAASPLSILHADAPPMFIIHGDKDVLAPVEYARLFAKELGEVSHQDVLYAELEGAQHAFEIFASPRTNRTVEAVERFLDAALKKYDGSARYNSPHAGTTPDENAELPIA